MIRTCLGLSTLVAGAVLATSVITASPGDPATARVVSKAPKFCAATKAITGTLPASLADLKVSAAKRAAKRLADLSEVAPNPTNKAVHALSKQLVAYARANGATARTTLVENQNAAYAANSTAVAGYVTRFCPDPVPTAPSFGPINAAAQTACLQDQAAIKQAEDLYSSVNGRFASVTDLVAAQFLRKVSSYYADVRVDDPPGGYTLIAVANGPCANLPVAG